MDTAVRLQRVVRRRARVARILATLRRYSAAILFAGWLAAIILATLAADAEGTSSRRVYVLRDGSDPIARIVVRASCAGEDGWAGVYPAEYDPPRVVLGCETP